jgi:hypothetical protein
VADLGGQRDDGESSTLVAPLGHALDPWHVRVASSAETHICSTR